MNIVLTKGLEFVILIIKKKNSFRYAFTPIVDFDDEEEDNITLSEAFGKTVRYDMNLVVCTV
jgi:hypothetical protein